MATPSAATAGCSAENDTANSTASEGHADVRRLVCPIVPFPVEAMARCCGALSLCAAGNGNYGMTGFLGRGGHRLRRVPGMRSWRAPTVLGRIGQSWLTKSSVGKWQRQDDD